MLFVIFSFSFVINAEKEFYRAAVLELAHLTNASYPLAEIPQLNLEVYEIAAKTAAINEGTTDRRGRSHPPHCTTSREDRQIVRMAETDLSVTSRTIAQHIESLTHHSVSASTIQRHLQQSGLSASRPMLGLPLTQNHRCLRHQWCDERRMWAAEWNEVAFTDESRICLQHHDGRI
ncbi:transposable element Tcb1 transposase [Trichonephila clavipes]|uniref:Transposable element Tcb1 transposase n=1 Tax=Trichonephila clavipes TaxID=2585209 RepID=A0A8X6VGB6_TRICX|nr:transposable element Tcb1 transposase [Trichonephila clavipes]